MYKSIQFSIFTFASNFFSLGLQLEWSQPQIQGSSVSPRAGHAGVSVDEKLFIVGGGDNKSGKSQMIFFFFCGGGIFKPLLINGLIRVYFIS